MAAVPLAPCVVVHGWDDACLALRAAQDAATAVTLLSAPSAAAFAGVLWWRSLVDGAARETGTIPADVLDCGDLAGLAVQALRSGCKVLVLDRSLPAWSDVADRAASLGCTLLPSRPTALDLLRPGATRGLRDWLRGT